MAAASSARLAAGVSAARRPEPSLLDRSPRSVHATPACVAAPRPARARPRAARSTPSISPARPGKPHGAPAATLAIGTPPGYGPPRLLIPYRGTIYVESRNQDRARKANTMEGPLVTLRGELRCFACSRYLGDFESHPAAHGGRDVHLLAPEPGVVRERAIRTTQGLRCPRCGARVIAEAVERLAA